MSSTFLSSGFCVDLGSQICRNSGFSDDELLALPRYRQSDLFTEREQLALDYTVNRFNAAFGIGSAGFSEGMACVPPDRPTDEPARLATV